MSQYPHGGQADDDRLIEDVLRHAEPRPQPAAEARDRAYRALRDEWLELTSAHRRRRWTVVVGVAAAIVAALGIGILTWQPAPDAVMVASVQRLSGDDIALNGARAAAQDLLDATLADGDRLITGRQSRIAVRWSTTGSMRIDEQSQLEFVSADTVRLVQGAVYYDSRLFGYEDEPSALVRVETPIGRITHRGTQFLATTDGENLTLSVREGTVRVQGPAVDVALGAGETIDIGAAGRFSRAGVEPYADLWQWAADIAPTASPHNVQEMLAWIARETGREVSYRSERAQQRAAGIGLSGFPAAGPREFLALRVAADTLRYTIDDARIVVDVRDPG